MSFLRSTDDRCLQRVLCAAAAAAILSNLYARRSERCDGYCVYFIRSVVCAVHVGYTGRMSFSPSGWICDANRRCTAFFHAFDLDPRSSIRGGGWFHSKRNNILKRNFQSAVSCYSSTCSPTGERRYHIFNAHSAHTPEHEQQSSSASRSFLQVGQFRCCCCI